MPITRRRLIAASGASLAAGGAAATLAACGGDGPPEPSAERDAELLQRALDAQASVSDLYRVARRQALDPPVADAIEAFDRRSSRYQRQLALRIEDAGGAPAEPDIRTAPAESVVEAIRIALDEAIAAEHGIVGHLSSAAARRTVYAALASDAAQLAAFRGILGEVQVPAAFVTGDDQPPLGTEGEGEAGEPEGEG